MFKKLLNKKLLKNQKGLTLIELLAVIVILAIIAAIAVPAIGNIIENSRYNAVKADAINVLNAANIYYTDNPETADGLTVETLKNDGYLDTAGAITDDATISKAVPRGLSDTVSYTDSKDVTFDGATIESINADSNKGSGAGGYTIGSEPATSSTP